MIDPRKLAAMDIATVGPTFIIGNFAGTALVCLSLGTFILWSANSYQKLTVGFYFFSLGINYIFMLFYALGINNRENARAAIGDELNKERRTIAEYLQQSIYLLLPLVVPIVALQRCYKLRSNR